MNDQHASMKLGVRCALVGACLAMTGLSTPATAQISNAQAAGGRLTTLSLDELANLEVTSVSRHAERIGDAPTAVFVITADDIRRSGVTNLGEALRLAPNLQVSRSDAAQYAISARGFNNAIANKLLVLIDGRTIYTPLFSGVFWDQQDVLLDDIERIEIISGPGATLWGANAVNGVINIMTRPARDTHGALVAVGGGNRQQDVNVRYGGAIGRSGHFRVYGKTVHLERTETASKAIRYDNRRWFQAGFRTDWGQEDHGFTLQGDGYSGRAADRGVVAGFTLDRVTLSGLNVLGRVRRKLSERSSFQIQSYFDHYKREDAILFQPDANLFDVDFQHGISWSRHRLLWGTGYRRGTDEVRDGILVGFRPAARDLNWGNVFAHDEFQLAPALVLSGGLKLERNDYTGWEYLPNARLAWKLSGDHLVWGAVSRAVRAPARLDREVVTPLTGAVLGGPNFVAEVANVAEIGYRGQPVGSLTASVTLFLHEWDKLRSGSRVPVRIENDISGPVYGVETWATWQAIAAWRLSGGVTAFRKRLRLAPGSTDPVGVNNPQLASDPPYQWTARSSWTFWSTHELDLMLRRTGALPNPIVPAYSAVDVRYAWRVRPELELSLAAQNLFDPGHPEFGAAASRSEFPRGAFIRARWLR